MEHAECIQHELNAEKGWESSPERMTHKQTAEGNQCSLQHRNAFTVLDESIRTASIDNDGFL